MLSGTTVKDNTLNNLALCLFGSLSFQECSVSPKHTSFRIIPENEDHGSTS